MKKVVLPIPAIPMIEKLLVVLAAQLDCPTHFLAPPVWPLRLELFLLDLSAPKVEAKANY